MGFWRGCMNVLDRILVSRWNKPFPVTLGPSAIGVYLAEKQGERQRQILREIAALGEGDQAKVRDIMTHPVSAFGRGESAGGKGREGAVVVGQGAAA